MNLETRTISYPNLRIHQDVIGGDTPMGPVADFFFFVWFSYSAFGVLLWALQVQEIAHAFFSKGMNHVKELLRSSVDMFSLVIVPLQFWFAPILSRVINVDDRELFLARSSNKNTYFILLAASLLLLHFCAKTQYTELLSILLSGFCCGIVHHASLFFYGMRGYSDVSSLLLTIMSEWPAVIVGIATIQRLGWPTMCKFVPFLTSDTSGKDRSVKGTGRGTKTFIIAMWLAIFYLLRPHVDCDKAIDYLMVYLPGKQMQSFGTFFLRTSTCMPNYLSRYISTPINCFDERASEQMLVLASPAKSGALLSGSIVAEIGLVCGLCVASGERSRAGIPGPIEDLPVYDGRILHAITNMRTWPEYVEKRGFDMRSLAMNEFNTNKRVMCNVIIREPMARVRSLYTYARSGGEHWFRTESGYMERLADPNLSLQQSLDFYWSEFGKEYLIESHEYIMQNLKLGCTAIRMEDLKSNFSVAMRKMFDAYGINQAAQQILLDRLSKQDTLYMSADTLKKSSHFTANKFSKKFLDEMNRRLLEMPEVKLLADRQSRELGYTV